MEVNNILELGVFIIKVKIDKLGNSRKYDLVG